MKKIRKPWLAAVLSFFAPGVGHLYVGAPLLGFTLIAFFFAALFLGGWFGIYSTFYGFIGLLVFCLVLKLILMVSAGLKARDAKEYEMRWYNRWYCYVLAVVLISLMWNVLFSKRGDLLGYATFSIPAPAMHPTLQTGDYITVDTRYSEPAVGHVVVFQYSENPKDYWVKRIAALGGDKISIESGEVIVNGEQIPALSVAAEYRQSRASEMMISRTIAEGEVFYLGDSRDNSFDSRSWGTSPEESILGQVTYIWLSRDLDRIGKKVE